MGGSWPGSCEAMELAQAGLSLSVPGSCVLMEVTCSTLEPGSKGDKNHWRGSNCDSPAPRAAESRALFRPSDNGPPGIQTDVRPASLLALLVVVVLLF